MYNVMRYTFLITISIAILSCDSMVANSSNDSDFDLTRFTDDDITEAKMLSLEMSGELEAPKKLWHRLAKELLEIRETLGDEYPAVHTAFRPRWVPGDLMVGLDDESAQLAATDSYHEWDTLNDRYGGEFQYIQQSPGHALAMLNHDISYNTILVSKLYESLSGVTYAGPNGYAGTGSTVFVETQDDSHTYTFALGNVGCPSGCLYWKYWVVKYTLSGARFERYIDNSQ
jgi:hypothetical protein